MAVGLYVMPDGSVMVAYGQRNIAISSAEYKANGYKPPFQKLAMRSFSKQRPPPRSPEAITERLSDGCSGEGRGKPSRLG